jgi:polar amino acid transport system substrate-binding protein
VEKTPSLKDHQDMIRKHNYILQFAALLLATMAPLGAQAQTPKATITIAADEWCPINCSTGGSQLGIGIDLAKKIFEPLGYQINYQIMPWTDALKQVRAGKVDAVIGASTQDDASLMFPANPVMAISDDFYVLSGNPWRYQGPYTLKDKRIGVIKDYGYGEVVRQFVEANKSKTGMVQFSSGNDALKQNIANLTNNKVDILVESKPVMDYAMRNSGNISLVWAGGVNQGPVYLAFSPALPASHGYASQYDAGIAKLKASGELEKMYRGYGLKP